jgi:hypothetical protein
MTSNTPEISELLNQRSIVVEKLVHYDRMIQKFLALKESAARNLARIGESLEGCEGDYIRHQDEMEESSTLVIDDTQPFIVTPINKNKKSKSRIDYNEQMNRQTAGKKLMWDDTSKNITKKAGGIFAFVHNDNKVEICQVTGVFDPDSRIPSWSENVGQTNRNVLELTDVIMTLTWDEWISHNGHRRVQGTTQVLTKDRLIEYIRSRM